MACDVVQYTGLSSGPAAVAADAAETAATAATPQAAQAVAAGGGSTDTQPVASAASCGEAAGARLQAPNSHASLGCQPLARVLWLVSYLRRLQMPLLRCLLGMWLESHTDLADVAPGCSLGERLCLSADHACRMLTAEGRPLPASEQERVPCLSLHFSCGFSPHTMLQVRPRRMLCCLCCCAMPALACVVGQ